MLYFTYIRLNPVKTRELKAFLAGGYSPYGLRTRRRAQAIWFSNQGQTVTQIAHQLRTSKRSVWKWFKTYQQKGLDGLKGKYFYRALM